MNLSTYAHPLATKAWMVTDDEHSHIVWCDHGMQAKRLGAQGIERDFDEVECERYPKLDGFHGDLLGWMLEEGWWFECGECYKHTGLTYPGFVRTEQDEIFCSDGCRVKRETEQTEKERVTKEFQRFAEVKYFGFGPRVMYVNVGGEALITLERPPPELSPHAYEFIAPAEICRSAETNHSWEPRS